jgi:hypothetical protein
VGSDETKEILAYIVRKEFLERKDSEKERG